MDVLGAILWFTMFLTPVITIPIAWRVLPVRKIYRILFGLFLAAMISFFLYYISLAIIFRDGM